MRKMLKYLGMFALLFAVFIVAGCVGILCEKFHNDLVVSTVSFLGSFGFLGHYAMHIYNSIV